MAEEAQAMKSPQPEADQPDEMSDRAKNAQTIIDQIDAELKRRGESDPEEGEDKMGEEAEAAPEGEGDESLKPLEEALGMTPERAQKIFDAAQQYGKTQGKSPDELAKMIADDFEVLMQLEMIAARGEEAQPEQAMPQPEAAPPAMPPAMAPQGEM